MKLSINDVTNHQKDWFNEFQFRTDFNTTINKINVIQIYWR